MFSWRCWIVLILVATVIAPCPKQVQAQEQGANAERHPRQILRTGVDLTSPDLSQNARQLAKNLKLTPLLARIQAARGSIDPLNFEPSPENLASSQQLIAATVMADQIIQESNLAVDFTLAEITAELNIYNEILSSYAGSRDKTIFTANAVSYLTNGALWAIGEAYDVPTYKYPRLSIPSGTVSILAGVVPSIASGYTLYALNGKKRTSEKDPNMLAKLFDYPTNPEIDYPAAVWNFLTSVPADDHSGKTRRDQLIDRWISDKNIPSFTDRSSKKQLDVITASQPQKKGLSIATLTVRQVMLQQLSSEILKMKRMLLEISMVVQGEKRI